MSGLKSILNLRNITRVETIIKKNIENINVPIEGDPTGQTILFGVISRGLDRHVSLLIRYGADVNYRDECGRTPIMKCAGLSSDRFMIIDNLRSAGADFSTVNIFKENLLGMLIDAANFPLVEKLVTDEIYLPQEVYFLTRRGSHPQRLVILDYLLSRGFTIAPKIIPICLKSAVVSKNVEHLKFWLQFFRLPDSPRDSHGESRGHDKPLADPEVFDVEDSLIVKQHHYAAINVIYPYLTHEQKQRYVSRAVRKENCAALKTLFILGLDPDIRIKYNTHTDIHEDISILELILILYGTESSGLEMARLCLKYGACPLNQRRLFFSGRSQPVENLIHSFAKRYPYSLTEACLIQIRKDQTDISKLPEIMSESMFDTDKLIR